MSRKEIIRVELSPEAANCLTYWQNHEMYRGTVSEVILQQMKEWLCRDMPTSSEKEIEREFQNICNGCCVKEN